MESELNTLEKLASNPHFHLSPKQLARLQELRNQTYYRHSTKVPKHDVKLKEEDDERSSRSTLPAEE